MIKKTEETHIGVPIEYIHENQDGGEAIGCLANVRILVEQDICQEMLTIRPTVSIVSEEDEEERTKQHSNYDKKTIQTLSQKL